MSDEYCITCGYWSPSTGNFGHCFNEIFVDSIRDLERAETRRFFKCKYYERKGTHEKDYDPTDCSGDSCSFFSNGSSKDQDRLGSKSGV